MGSWCPEASFHPVLLDGLFGLQYRMLVYRSGRCVGKEGATITLEELFEGIIDPL